MIDFTYPIFGSDVISGRPKNKINKDFLGVDCSVCVIAAKVKFDSTPHEYIFAFCGDFVWPTTVSSVSLQIRIDKATARIRNPRSLRWLARMGQYNWYAVNRAGTLPRSLPSLHATNMGRFWTPATIPAIYDSADFRFSNFSQNRRLPNFSPVRKS